MMEIDRIMLNRLIMRKITHHLKKNDLKREEIIKIILNDEEENILQELSLTVLPEIRDRIMEYKIEETKIKNLLLIMETNKFVEKKKGKLKITKKGKKFKLNN
jgi:hypothetical protein